MRINQNIAALNAYRNLTVTDSRLNKSLERLSSGLRINRAADDAAGLAISEKMRAQIRGLNMAIRNAQDGISLIQTAEGALNEVHAALQRMRELAIQAANDTLTAGDRFNLQQEIDQLVTEIDRIANSTEFNTKKLLDGSASAVVSTDSPSTRVYMRGGLRIVDDFGQSRTGGGNYRIEVDINTMGKPEVQKSNIMMAKHGITVRDLVLDEDAGITKLEAANLQQGDYQLVTESNKTAGDATVSISQQFLQSAAVDHIFGDGFDPAGTISVANDLGYNASIALEVTNFDHNTNTLTFKATSHQYDKDGNYTKITVSDLTFNTNDINDQTITVGDITITIKRGTAYDAQENDYRVGDKVILDVTAQATGDDDSIQVGYDSNGDKNYDVVHNWVGNDQVFNNAATAFKFFTLDKEGNVYDGEVQLNFGGLGSASPAAAFTYGEGVGDIASLNTRLYDINNFWDANGKFLLEHPQTITLVQGDGRKTQFSIDLNDTLGSLQQKINEAIEKDLGQGRYVSDNIVNPFATYVTNHNKTEEGITTTPGTLVIRSVIPGRQGQLAFIGNEELVKALGLSQIQEATETSFDVAVYDAHTGEEVGTATISSNLLVGVVHPNVDVEFDPLAGLGIVEAIDAETGSFDFDGVVGETYTTTIHLADNTMVLQLGANPGQDVSAAIGRMDSYALNLRNVLVTDRLKASFSIDFLNKAIDFVSSERSKLGAVQNRLELTVNSLMVARENLTAAESRIRDLDMAEEMMEFTKGQILVQAGTAMLAQANMKPQTVLQLLAS